MVHQTAAEVAAHADHPPQAPLQTEEFRAVRPQIVGSESPEAPFPIFIHGPVQHGFGRGKDLGCPTANLPDESMAPLSTAVETGVYYGYAQVVPPKDEKVQFREEDLKVLPMVMSLGWNRFYKNEKLTAEVHIMHEFQSDFYGLEMRAIVLGYIRPELDYTSREALIDDIDIDKKVALNSLNRPAYRRYANDAHFNLDSTN
ncbi:Riboflavin kinase [Hypsizygus marmoreus]|uniref:Riboflavin kinase n=1 Tax=Hypsizygus marmoreus TaxID=39966 RepID=A0A369JN05_HYPMA|nr:Riboflavin kinase [Hypsizygus marmoreus]